MKAAPEEEAGAGAAFPWADAMAAGIGRLGLPPAAFWAMTPRELAAALGAGGRSGGAAPSRGTLDALIERYPDSMPPCR